MIINDDASKIEIYNVPSIALVVWLCVDPINSTDYKWINYENTSGIPKDVDIKNMMTVKCKSKFQPLENISLKPTANFNKMEIIAFVYRH